MYGILLLKYLEVSHINSKKGFGFRVLCLICVFFGNMLACLVDRVHFSANLRQRVVLLWSSLSRLRTARADSYELYSFPSITASAFFWHISIFPLCSIVKLLWNTGAANSRIERMRVLYKMLSWSFVPPRFLNRIKTHKDFVARLVMFRTWADQDKLLVIVTPSNFVSWITSSGSQFGKFSWGRKLNFLEKLKQITLVFLWFIFIPFAAVNSARSASWCCSIEFSAGRYRPEVSLIFLGPMILGEGARVNLRLILSSMLRSSTYFFLLVFSFWWHGGRGPWMRGRGSWPSLGRRGSMVQGAPARLTWRLKKITVNRPPPGIAGRVCWL